MGKRYYTPKMHFALRVSFKHLEALLARNRGSLALILGICIVDAFYAYKLEMKQAREDPHDFTFFIGRLAHQLVFNQFLAEGMKLRDMEDDIQDEKEVSESRIIVF